LYDISGNGNGPTIGTVPNTIKIYTTKIKVSENPRGPADLKCIIIWKEKSHSWWSLCNDGWCSGYRNARRMRNTPDTSMEHIGFRCVRDTITLFYSKSSLMKKSLVQF
jgi:hypothetical protein